jgi:hypothetical protein
MDQTMKFQAPPGVSALSCAGEEFFPDPQGFFEAAENLADALLAHGCVPSPQTAEAPRPKSKRKAD